MSEMGYEDREQGRPSRGRRAAQGSEGGSKRNLLIIGGAAVAVILIVTVVAVVAMGGGGDKKPQAAAAAKVKPRVYVNTPANPQVKKLADRAKDKRPLNKNEVFGDDDKTVTHGKYTFTLAGADLASDCKTVTWGQQLQSDLAKYGCTQIARGAYVSNDKQYVGQFIAINLENLQGAEQLVRDLDPDSGAGFVSPFAVKGSTDFSDGFSAAYSQAFGHYVVVSWVEKAGGAQPQSMNELLDASIAIERADDFVWERLVLAGA
ncbi:hypothetical protein NE235_05000 [Actinoallomurus spadix]|uniref:hypothetical protein n=1 Tax=Actinoallomurus spadix TaxID=79912 RepID=UPI002093DFFC|nr:hypothetical protein [Actinoallomurus spadix]MCO5985461.1 hypothetical protein [Actinoallomurus spadix]